MVPIFKHFGVPFLAAAMAITAPLYAQENEDSPPPNSSFEEPYDYVLFFEYSKRSQDLNGSGSGRSGGHQALAERIMASSENGTEIEYLLLGEGPHGVIGWHFPARVMVAPDGTKDLLNGEEAQARLDAFLAEAAIPREACGQWGFSWTAYQIRCDNEAIIEHVEGFGMRPALIEQGTAIDLPGAIASPVLYKAGARNGRQILRAEIGIDPKFVREQQAQSAVNVAQINGEELPIEQAREELASLFAFGSITVEFEVDTDGLVWKRSETTIVTLTGVGIDETRIARQVVRRFTAAEWAQWEATPGEERDWSFR